MACKRSAVRSRLPPPSRIKTVIHRLQTSKKSYIIRKLLRQTKFLSPSSRGLGHRPFTAITGVRIPVGTPNKEDPYKSQVCKGFFFSEVSSWTVILIAVAPVESLGNSCASLSRFRAYQPKLIHPVLSDATHPKAYRVTFYQGA